FLFLLLGRTLGLLARRGENFRLSVLGCVCLCRCVGVPLDLSLDYFLSPSQTRQVKIPPHFARRDKPNATSNSKHTLFREFAHLVYVADIFALEDGRKPSHVNDRGGLIPQDLDYFDRGDPSSELVNAERCWPKSAFSLAVTMVNMRGVIYLER